MNNNKTSDLLDDLTGDIISDDNCIQKEAGRISWIIVTNAQRRQTSQIPHFKAKVMRILRELHYRRLTQTASDLNPQIRSCERSNSAPSHYSHVITNF